MKKPNSTPLYAASLFLALTALSLPSARAELVSQNVHEDAITPEAGDDEVVVIKKRPQPAAPAAPVIVNQHANSTASAASSSQATAQAPAKASVGAALDNSMNAKMDDVRNQFENALLKTMDRIKITVDDGSAPAVAQAAPAAPAPVPAAPATTTVVVQDNIAGKNSAPAYLSVDNAPEMKDDADAESEAKVEEKEPSSSKYKVSVAPVFGKTMINSNLYNIDSRYTAGFEIEMGLDDNFSAVAGYSYSQFNLGLATGNPFYGMYSNSLLMNNMGQLQYNQNVFNLGVRAYLMPPEAKFRVFGGAGVGYNLGYLNYNQNVLNQYAFNPAMNTPDYQVRSWLGLLEAGGAFNISQRVSLGAIFKYALIFSSSQNQPLNNYAFVNNGYGYTPTTDQRIVGGSLAQDSFYSILGTVKVSF